LNNISAELYEAASIDGATWFQKFKNITLPLLMPSFTVVLFLTLSSGFKMLDINIALTGGDFNTTMLSYEILKTVRESSPPDYGIAQAEAVVFFVIVAVISITQVVIMKRKEIEAS
jgi:raffinose/stachyose/melibiose transport system permease protein